MESTGTNLLIGSTITFTVFAGACVLLLMYIIKLLKADQKHVEDESKNENTVEQSDKKKEPGSSGKNKKKGAEGRWINRSDKGYTHPWLLTSLKGHTGQVLDMDFSSHGKYLASCAEEDPDPGGELGGDGSSSDYNKENSRPSSTPPSPRTKGLSRRQRKNRRREDSSPPENKRKPKTKRPEPIHHKKPICNAPLKQYMKLNLAERDLAAFLRSYLLSPEQMLTLGYPVESSLHPGRAIIFKSPANVPAYTQSDYRHTKIDVNESRFDVNAQEFIPSSYGAPGIAYADIKAEWNASHDSGQGSGTSSDSGENLDDSEESSASDCVPSTIINASITILDKSDSSDNSDSSSTNHGTCSSENFNEKHSSGTQETSEHHNHCENKDILNEGNNSVKIDSGNNKTNEWTQNTLIRKNQVSRHDEVGVSEERKCVRCGKGFFVANDNEYLTQERCSYHWGKMQSVITPGMGKHTKAYGFSTEYACCHGKPGSRGCTTGKLHVWNGLSVGFNGPLDLYTRTRPRKSPPPDGNYGVYALDCEMCYTVTGLELTKITVIGADGRLVYDCFVKPEYEIVDYNTRFSGITAKDLNKKSATKTLREVQNDLMGFINADTILIGHGLENDLRALRIMHCTVVDTAVTFPHYNGLPYRRSLKSLTSCFLKRDIQSGQNGHNSLEDARACMELMLWRVRKDFRSILDHYQHQ